MEYKNRNIQSLRATVITVEKNIKIYYAKPPVLIFGIIFPLFMFISFFLGRKLDFYTFFPGFLAMSLFFTSSSVGPLITPWEKSAGTYERLLSFPVTVNTIILGDIIAGLIYGIAINILVLAGGIIFLDYKITVWSLIVGMLLSSFCFSSLGVLLASPAVKSPSNIMMLSSVVRFPLIFISGIFIPLSELSMAGRILSYISPITYIVDIFSYSLKGSHYIPIIVDFSSLLAFSALFLFLANRLHRRNLLRGL